MNTLFDRRPLAPVPRYCDAITIAQRVRLPLGGREVEAEVVAVPRADGSECCVDVFLVDADARAALGDEAFLRELRTALARLGFPAGSLAYCDADEQEAHCVALIAGPDFAQAVLACATAHCEAA